MGFRYALRLGSLDARSAQSVNSDAHVVRIYDQDHFAPAGAKMGRGREIFWGCTGSCKKYWRKSSLMSGLFLFFGGPRPEKGNFAPRAAARNIISCRLTAARVIRTQKAA